VKAQAYTFLDSAWNAFEAVSSVSSKRTCIGRPLYDLPATVFFWPTVACPRYVSIVHRPERLLLVDRPADHDPKLPVTVFHSRRSPVTNAAIRLIMRKRIARRHPSLLLGPAPRTASILAASRSERLSGVSQSMQLNCRMSKCRLPMSDFLQVQKTGICLPRA